jgi:predicted acyltransferase (DUF342 family)
MIEKALESYQGYGIISLSKLEEVIETDKVEMEPNQSCKSLIYAENSDFMPREGIVFQKEIYVRKNAYLERIPLLRAIACDGDLSLGSGTRIIRWADAEGTLTSHDNCDLGISTTSAKKLLVGRNCLFKRLYAPEIWLGLGDGGPDTVRTAPVPEEAVINEEIMRDIEYVDDEITDENGILPYTIVTRKDLTVVGGYVVQGHISCDKDVEIGSGAVVHGNIFAEGSVFIGSNAVVLGLVFTQEDVYVDDGSVIGQPNKVKSVVARGDIEFGSNCRVYGYIGTEKNGRICPEA